MSSPCWFGGHGPAKSCPCHQRLPVPILKASAYGPVCTDAVTQKLLLIMHTHFQRDPHRATHTQTQLQRIKDPLPLSFYLVVSFMAIFIRNGSIIMPFVLYGCLFKPLNCNFFYWGPKFKSTLMSFIVAKYQVIHCSYLIESFKIND